MFTVYEAMSVLKNMALAGLPVQPLWEKLKFFLEHNTGEIIKLEDNESDKKS